MGPQPFPERDARRLVRSKVRSICKPPLFPSSALADVEQDVLLHAIQHWSNFDRRRGEPGALLSRLIHNKVMSMMRYESAAKRGRLRTRPLSVWHLAPRDTADPDAMALRRFLRKLPEPLSELVWAVSQAGSVAGAARLLNLPRRTLRDRLGELAVLLRRGGFGPPAGGPIA